jgi:DNA polymerase III subunit beta
MRVKIQKSHILPVLSKIQGLTGRKTNLAITTSVLIRATESGVSFSATDLETGFEGYYPADVESLGSVALNSRKLFEIIRDFPNEDIVFQELENHWVEIGNSTVEYHIVGMNIEDFPEIPKIESEGFFAIESASLASLIQKSVIISAAADDRRAHIIGVYAEWLDLENNYIFRMVSTDGSRLSKTDALFDKSINLPLGSHILIPKKSLIEVAKFLDVEGTVQISFKENNLIIKKHNENIVIRLLQGEFPKYSDIIAKPAGYAVKLDRHLFLMMLKRMSILGSEDYKGVIFNFETDKLTISSTNPDIGESKEEMPIDYKGNKMTIMFNPRYFLDTLNVIDDENVIVNISSEDRPCLVSGEKDENYISVIMPMRI